MMTHFENAAPFKTPANFNDEQIPHQCDCEQLRAEVLSLKKIVLKLENRPGLAIGSNRTILTICTEPSYELPHKARKLPLKLILYVYI